MYIFLSSIYKKKNIKIYEEIPYKILINLKIREMNPPKNLKQPLINPGEIEICPKSPIRRAHFSHQIQ